MKLAIVGSRGFRDYEFLKTEIIVFAFENSIDITEIISGGAKGADRMAEIFAAEKKLPTKIFLPDWDKYGKSAGFRRNELIINEADAVIAFWDGTSRGTLSSINLAKEKNKLLKIVQY